MGAAIIALMKKAAQEDMSLPEARKKIRKEGRL